MASPFLGKSLTDLLAMQQNAQATNDRGRIADPYRLNLINSAINGYQRPAAPAAGPAARPVARPAPVAAKPALPMVAQPPSVFQPAAAPAASAFQPAAAPAAPQQPAMGQQGGMGGGMDMSSLFQMLMPYLMGQQGGMGMGGMAGMPYGQQRNWPGNLAGGGWGQGFQGFGQQAGQYNMANRAQTPGLAQMFGMPG